ncbi:ABC transporter permease [Rufibacter glacialis]|uniref:ABC transporter permease n=1 Tax=Rufibacter glacialis TaxID=1259555 RepID=A0A5M8QEE6_9BACT|nr:ABC transporter permease [Rufibacter glacialis]KAA6434415.1 hypothetical protein FOE74_09460 [Rufibacter glacialis]GGK69379.1 hypothetical protein GCM10011405_16830 [Rufibacter glacialis]
MSTITTYLGRGVSAEALKLKHTWALWLSLLAPLSIVSMTFLVFFFKGHLLLKPGSDPWFFWATNNFLATSQLLLPLFLALLTALVNGTEHQSGGWKQLYTQPVPKWSVFLNKYLLVLGLVVLSFVTFWVGLLVGGYFLGLLRPELGFQKYHHEQEITLAIFRILVASLFVFTLQFCLCFRCKSIALSIGLGILFTMAFLIGSRWEHIGYYPYSWTYFASAAFSARTTEFFVPQMWYSLVGSLGLFALGLWDSCRRQIQ